MPLAAYFLPPIPADAQVRAQVLTAVRLLPGDTRYLPATVQNTLVSLDASGRTAQVSGEVLLSGETPAKSVWVLAVAYDAGGEVVGLRRWESAAELSPGSPLKFSLQVSSLGPVTQQIRFLVEARP